MMLQSVVRSRTRLRSEERGSSTLEFALLAPILLIILLGVIEFGRAYERIHAIVGISREAANQAARGTTLQEAVTVALSSGQDINLAGNGGVIATEVRKQGQALVVRSQYASAGYAGRSRVGSVGQPAGQLATRNLPPGQTAYVVEVFYTYRPITPLRPLANITFPGTLYERSVF